MYNIVQYKIPVNSAYEQGTIVDKTFYVAFPNYQRCTFSFSEMKLYIDKRIRLAKEAIAAGNENYYLELSELEDVRKQLNYMNVFDWKVLTGGLVGASINFTLGMGSVRILDIDLSTGLI